MKRAAIATGVAIIVIVAIAIVYLLRNLDSLVADAIETYGSRATGTRVAVGSVEIHLRDGRGTIRGLRVANPEGFSEPNAFAWDEVTVDIDPASVTSPPYVVDEVRIVAPEVDFELNERGQANLRELQKRLQRGGEEAGAPSEPAEKGESGEAPRLRIRSFTFERGRVDVHSEAVGGKEASAELPPLRLTDVGGESGATPTEIGREVLEAYTAQILKTVARKELDRRVEEAIDEHLGDETGKAAKGLLDRLGAP